MKIYAVFLRGINVGGKAIVNMADLKKLQLVSTTRNWNTLERIIKMLDGMKE